MAIGAITLITISAYLRDGVIPFLNSIKISFLKLLKSVLIII